MNDILTEPMKDSTVICPKCGRYTWCMGRVDNTVMCCDPLAWYEWRVCHHCKIKVKKLIQGYYKKETGAIKDYEEV